MTGHGIASKRNTPLWEKHPTLTAGLISIVAALIAGAIGYLGAITGAQTSLEVAAAQTQSEDNQRAQDRRDVVYEDFLDAANKYFYAWDSNQKRAPGAPLETASLTHFLNARFEYRGRLNDVFVHGSNDGWAATQKLNSTLPQFVSDAEFPSFRQELDPVAFREAFNDLLEIRCREAAPVSRSSCSAD